MLKIAALALVVVACDASKKQDHTEPAAAETPPPAANAPVIAVTARQLAEDYEAGRDSAEAKYRGKPVRLTGIVDHTGGGGGDSFIDFLGPHRTRVQAHFVDGAAIANLKRNQVVTVRCLGDGEFGGPQLTSCTVEKVE